MLKVHVKTGNCERFQYCLACSQKYSDKCEACFNYSYNFHAGIHPRVLDQSVTPNNCKTLMPDSILVDKCRWYIGTTLNTQTQQTIDLCQICKAEILFWNDSTKKAKCVNSKDEDFVMKNCQRIDNCLTTVCYKDNNGNATYGCRMCKKDYYGSSFDIVNSAGSKVCNKGKLIENCQFTIQTSDLTHKCFSCKPFYAVKYDESSCIPFTNDVNCRVSQDTTDCYYCWHSYYWDNLSCRLHSNYIKMLAFNMIVLIVLMTYLLDIDFCRVISF